MLEGHQPGFFACVSNINSKSRLFFLPISLGHVKIIARCPKKYAGKRLLSMIITTRKSLSRYKSMGVNMKKAIEYIDAFNGADLEPGRFDVEGDDVYAVIQCYNTKQYDEGMFETHDCYIDIQIILEGEELMYTAQREDMSDATPYIPEKDKNNYGDNKEAMCTHMKPGTVMVFYPEDAHKACIQAGSQPVAVKKLLLKVRLDSEK